ncbi:DUF2442 domain-containing protein [Zobellella aerophila]|uniref:DUF2442 domain-containing protein n=1 Tax=Zobellella aerophila TaxID=870480 RepID=UPI003CD0623B
MTVTDLIFYRHGIPSKQLIYLEDVQSLVPINHMLTVQVSRLESEGLWLRINGLEYFLGYDLFPWLRNASESKIYNVESFGENGIRWPDLDVDLTLDIIQHPQRYPLTYINSAEPAPDDQSSSNKLLIRRTSRR